MAVLSIDPWVMRRALYESVAESSKPQHAQLLLALEKGVRFSRALQREGPVGDKARAALPAVRALATGKCTRAQAEAAARRIGLQPETVVAAAAAMRLRNDVSPAAKAAKALANQIEAASSSPEVGGRVWNKIKRGAKATGKGIKKGVTTVTKTAHKITHTGPIADIERKLQDTVGKYLPITKPFINIHKQIAGKFTQKVLAKGGLIKQPKGTKPIGKLSIKNVADAAGAAVPALKPLARAVPASRPAAPASRPAAAAKVRRVKVKSGRTYEIAVRRVV